MVQAFALPQNPQKLPVLVKSSALLNEPAAARESLRLRIDQELAGFGPLEVSSWMIAQPPPPPATALEDHREPATEVELDAAVGGLFWRTRADLERTHCFHVIGADGGLLAVCTPTTGALSVRSLVAVDELPGMQLHRRPIAAGAPPPDYRSTRLAAALWRFALFGPDGDQALPAHYCQLPLKLHQPPTLDRELVAGRHLKLMRLLHKGRCTFHELLETTGLSDKQLRRDLAALLLVGCLVIA